MKEGRILRSKQTEYAMAEYTGRNNSGLRPVGDRVLILVDTVQEKTKGGIYIPGAQQDAGNAGCTHGVLVDVGPDAFLWNMDRTAAWQGDKPAPGDRVYFQRYAGELYEGTDGLEYRVMDDKAIGAIGARPESKAIAAE